MPFGLTNALSTFMAAMNDLFQSFLRWFVVVFFDDILVYSLTWEEHLNHLQQVLKLLQRSQFYAKWPKCVFGTPSMD